MTSLCSANTFGGIYNELAKSITPGNATKCPKQSLSRARNYHCESHTMECLHGKTASYNLLEGIYANAVAHEVQKLCVHGIL